MTQTKNRYDCYPYVRRYFEADPPTTHHSGLPKRRGRPAAQPGQNTLGPRPLGLLFTHAPEVGWLHRHVTSSTAMVFLRMPWKISSQSAIPPLPSRFSNRTCRKTRNTSTCWDHCVCVPADVHVIHILRGYGNPVRGLYKRRFLEVNQGRPRVPQVLVFRTDSLRAKNVRKH